MSQPEKIAKSKTFMSLLRKLVEGGKLGKFRARYIEIL
jgi:hypothetical protein